MGRRLARLAQRDDRLPGRAIVLLFRDPFNPLPRVDTLKRQPGGGADEAVGLGQQRPEGPDGRLDPSSAVGILEDFASAHPDFPATGTFYVPRNAFEGDGRTAERTFRCAGEGSALVPIMWKMPSAVAFSGSMERRPPLPP